MKYLFSLAIRSAWNRRFTLGLTLIVITFSIAMMLAIERLRIEVKESFAQSISGTDLIVGPRTNPLQLILYSVFHIGQANNNMSWDSALMLSKHPAVASTIPITLGDSHKNFPVIGTTINYFSDFEYGDHLPLTFKDGKPFNSLFDVVLGYEVAKKLNYKVGDKIILSHGETSARDEHEDGHESEHEHSDKPFIVSGILEKTGTPVDRALHINLEAVEAIHLNWQSGTQIPGINIPPEYVKKFNLTPKQVSAVLVKLKSRTGVFMMQRFINEYKQEPLTAILPGIALDQLWKVLGSGERALLLVSLITVIVGFIGLIAVMLASLNERRRELAILRSVGAKPIDIFYLLVIESVLIVLIGALLAYLLLFLISWCAAPLLMTHYGLMVKPMSVNIAEIKLICAAVIAGILLSLLPAYQAYRLSLADGLIPRV